MLILVMGVAQTKAFVLDLTTPAASKRQNAVSHDLHCRQHGVFTNDAEEAPQKRQCSPAIGLAAMRLEVMGAPSLGGQSHPSRSFERCITHLIALSSSSILISLRDAPIACNHTVGRAHAMSQLSKVKHSRYKGEHKATSEATPIATSANSSLACITAERDQATTALQVAQARLRQFESQPQELGALSKVDVVFLALQLFFVAPIGFRAVSRVLSLLAWLLGIKKAPCPQTVINWVIRLSIVRIEAARSLKGLPLRQAPFTNGLIWMLDISIGLGTGKILAVLAFDAQHHQRTPGALSLEHVHCIGGCVADAWTGETIAELHGRLIAHMGPASCLPQRRWRRAPQGRCLTGGQRTEQPLPRRYLARRGRDAQACLPSAPGIRDLCVSLWSGLGQAQAYDAGVFGASQRAHPSPLYECAPLVHLGRPLAEALANGRCQERLDLSQVAGLPRSIARLQIPHQAVSKRYQRSP